MLANRIACKTWKLQTNLRPLFMSGFTVLGLGVYHVTERRPLPHFCLTSVVFAGAAEADTRTQYQLSRRIVSAYLYLPWSNWALKQY